MFTLCLFHWFSSVYFMSVPLIWFCLLYVCSIDLVLSNLGLFHWFVSVYFMSVSLVCLAKFSSVWYVCAVSMIKNVPLAQDNHLSISQAGSCWWPLRCIMLMFSFFANAPLYTYWIKCNNVHVFIDFFPFLKSNIIVEKLDHTVDTDRGIKVH